MSSSPAMVRPENSGHPPGMLETPQSSFPLAWLRDRCECGACRHPSGQRLLDPANIPVELHAVHIDIDGDMLTVTWMPEAHRSTYSIEALRSTPTSAELRPLWDASAEAQLPTAQYQLIAAKSSDGKAQLLAWLRAVDSMGCGLLHGVPTRSGEVARVAEQFGYVRETNYGRWFDVRSVVDPANLANSSLGLAPHTDNPYRDPVPTLQLLHCLESTARGGDSMLVDGWRIATEVRSLQPAGFALLTSSAVTFEYRDATAALSASAPLIEVDGNGAIRSVRFNPRSMRQPWLRSDDLAQWYAAYLLFARLVADQRFHITFRLDPGDLFIVDNRRVLHGRTAFEPSTGGRHLQGCYADIDGLRSTISILSAER